MDAFQNNNPRVNEYVQFPKRYETIQFLAQSTEIGSTSTFLNGIVAHNFHIFLPVFCIHFNEIKTFLFPIHDSSLTEDGKPTTQQKNLDSNFHGKQENGEEETMHNNKNVDFPKKKTGIMAKG